VNGADDDAVPSDSEFDFIAEASLLDDRLWQANTA
jgi:hypothetical protein